MIPNVGRNDIVNENLLLAFVDNPIKVRIILFDFIYCPGMRKRKDVNENYVFCAISSMVCLVISIELKIYLVNRIMMATILNAHEREKESCRIFYLLFLNKT